jgi:hypothetical protein
MVESTIRVVSTGDHGGVCGFESNAETTEIRK